MTLWALHLCTSCWPTSWIAYKPSFTFGLFSFFSWLAFSWSERGLQSEDSECDRDAWGSCPQRDAHWCLALSYILVLKATRSVAHKRRSYQRRVRRSYAYQSCTRWLPGQYNESASCAQSACESRSSLKDQAHWSFCRAYPICCWFACRLQSVSVASRRASLRSHSWILALAQSLSLPRARHWSR